jgi:hypothetical protein
MPRLCCVLDARNLLAFARIVYFVGDAGITLTSSIFWVFEIDLQLSWEGIEVRRGSSKKGSDG